MKNFGEVVGELGMHGITDANEGSVQEEGNQDNFTLTRNLCLNKTK